MTNRSTEFVEYGNNYVIMFFRVIYCLQSLGRVIRGLCCVQVACSFRSVSAGWGFSLHSAVFEANTETIPQISQDRQCMHNVTLWYVSVTIDSMEILQCILCFLYYLINDTIFGRKIEYKKCLLIFSTTSSEIFLIIKSFIEILRIFVGFHLKYSLFLQYFW